MIDDSISIGLVIEQKLNELGINKSEFGRLIGVANQNVNRILEKKSIDTDKLIAISNALGYNFFLEFTTTKTNNSAVVNGNSSVAVNGSNSSVVAGGEVAILQERVKHLEELLAEKERLIKVYEKMMEGK